MKLSKTMKNKVWSRPFNNINRLNQRTSLKD